MWIQVERWYDEFNFKIDRDLSDNCYFLCRIVNYEGLKKQNRTDKNHWEKYCPTSIDNLLLGTTWLYFYKDFIGLRRGLLIDPKVKSLSVKSK